MGSDVDKRGFIGWLRGAVVVTIAAMLITQAFTSGVVSEVARRLGFNVPAGSTATWTVQSDKDEARRQKDAAATQAYAEQTATEPVTATYLDAKGDTQMVDEAVVIAPETSALENDWYVSEGNVKLPEGLTVTGDVNIILGEGRLYLGKAIEIPAGSSLHIYCKPGCQDSAKLSCVFTDRVINNSGTLELYGGSVGNGAAAAVYNQGTFVMYGGLITGCYNNAVVNLQTGSFRLLGGAICDNQRAGITGTGTLSVAGAPVVENNAGGNVLLGKQVVVDDENPIEGTETIYVEGKLARGTRIGVTTEDYDAELTRGFGEHNPGARPGQRFFSDYNGLGIVANRNGEAILAEPKSHK